MHKHHHKHATLAPSDPTGPATTTQTAVASGDKDHKAPLVSAEDIRLRAYRKWETRESRPGTASRSGWKRSKSWCKVSRQ